MTTDLFGKSLTPPPDYTLSLWQKRQAAMLYRWMSLDYLKGLKERIDRLIAGADTTLDLAKRQGRDALIANPRWGVRDTSSNWSTYAYPALEEFRQSTIWHISALVNEEYGKTGAGQCDRMLSEFSSMWMTPDEEEQFNKQFDAVYAYASKIDAAAGAGGQRTLHDSTMVDLWVEDGAPFIPLRPKFRVRTNVEGVTGKRPPRTGVYVPQDDPNGVLQFAWTGNDDGKLGRVQTFNETGLDALRGVGRAGLWLDERRMVDYVKQALKQGRLKPVEGYSADDLAGAHITLFEQCFTERPCKWYFVEMIDGEFDDASDEPSNAVAEDTTRLRCEAGQPCPKAGWWFTPAKADSRRLFKAGEVMPEVSGDYGATIWQWDERQQG